MIKLVFLFLNVLLISFWCYVESEKYWNINIFLFLCSVYWDLIEEINE